MADIADPYFGELASGVARGADEAGLVVTVAMTERDPVRELRLVRALRGQRPRGLILAASRMSDEVAPELQRELDLLVAGGGRVVALGGGAGSVRAIHIDNFGGAAALGRTLAERGYRNTVVLGAAEGLITSDARIDGFTSGFTAGGGEPPRIYRGGLTRDSAKELMRQAMADGIEPGSIVFCIADAMAIGAMNEINAAGRGVGHDIALAGFDDIPTARDVSPALTTVHVPLRNAGYQALRAAVDEEWEQDSSSLDVRVVLRDSTPPIG